MQCLPYINLSTDEPYWVTRDTFTSCFSQDDFHVREVQEVKSAYRADWFIESETGLRSFVLPVVGLVGGKTQFISGRHRTAVLLRYLAELPIALAFGELSAEAKKVLRDIPKRALSPTEEFWLPDLPIHASLP